VTGFQVLPLPGKGNYLCMLVAVTTYPPTAENKRLLRRPRDQKLGREEILQIAYKMGLVDELDGKPLADKLRQWSAEAPELLVCDAVCDDPYNTDALCALLEFGEEVSAGLGLAAMVCGNCETCTVTYRAKDGGRRAVRLLNNRLGKTWIDVTGKYPVWPNLSLYKPFSEKKFARIGVQACLRLYRAVRSNRPPTKCVVTVSGSAVREPQNFSVTIGTPLSSVLNQCALYSEGCQTMAIRSAITGLAVTEPDRTPVLQDTRCILAMAEPPKFARACSGCGQCVPVCPANVFPLNTLRALERGETERAIFYGMNRCIGCGACSVVCPADIPIPERIQRGALKKPKTLELWQNRGE
jgi:electron transport complex protein RnfC